ncbi:hypothetical protein C2I33_16385 [Ralstonia solanacearum]|nr:hypothetical protein C2124_22880 [Ralstonia solanacearum]TYZ53940.1 hypothetical protein C2I33_16385 [Ralstonia solanacearum]
MQVLSGTIRRAVGDHVYPAPLDGRTIGCFAIVEAADAAGDAPRSPFRHRIPRTGPRLADVSRSAGYCAPVVP